VWHLQQQLEDVHARVPYSSPGDIVVMRRAGGSVDARGVLREGAPGHIGIVEGYGLAHASLLTIEGNIGDEVVRVEHPMPSRDVLAYYRWPVDAWDVVTTG
jgi:hypothetical protein